MDLVKAKSRAIANAQELDKPYVIFHFENGDYGTVIQEVWENPKLIGEEDYYWDNCEEVEIIEPHPKPDERVQKLITEAISHQLITRWGWEENCPTVYFPDGKKWLLGNLEEFRFCLESLIKGAELTIDKYMKCEVFLASEEFGTELFDYSNLSEAKAGFERLKESCLKGTAEDSFKRKLTLALSPKDASSELFSQEINPNE